MAFTKRYNNVYFSINKTCITIDEMIAKGHSGIEVTSTNMRISDVSEKRIWSHETAIYYPSTSPGAAINVKVNFSITPLKPFLYSVSIERDNRKRREREQTDVNKLAAFIYLQVY